MKQQTVRAGDREFKGHSFLTTKPFLKSLYVYTGTNLETDIFPHSPFFILFITRPMQWVNASLDSIPFELNYLSVKCHIY